MYVALLVGPLLLAMAAEFVGAAVVAVAGEDLPLGPAGVAPAVTVLTTVGAGALVVLLRTATWHGPAVLSAADVAWLLSSPQPRASLLRPRLVRTLRRSALLGAAAGAVCGIMAAEVLGSLVLVRGALGAGAGAALALVGQALSWWTVGGLGRARAMLRATPVASVVLLGASAAALASPGFSWALGWSGPWGWAGLAMAAPAPAAAAAMGLLAVVAGAAASWTLRRADLPTVEELARRSAVGGGVTNALWIGDQQSALRLASQAADALRGPPRLRLPAPRSPALAILWRDATVALRRPGSVAAGLAAAAVGSACATLGAGALGAASAGVATAPTGAEWALAGDPRATALLALGAAAALGAAGALLGPLRSSLAWPFGHLHLPWADQNLLRRHIVLPAVALLAAGLAGVGAAWAGSHAGIAGLGWVDGSHVAAGPAVLWVLATFPALVVLAVAGELRPPPDPVEVSMSLMTEVAATQQFARQAAQALPSLFAVGASTGLLVVMAVAPTPSASGAIAAVAAGWAAAAAAVAWLWVRTRPMPWQ